MVTNGGADGEKRAGVVEQRQVKRQKPKAKSQNRGPGEVRGERLEARVQSDDKSQKAEDDGRGGWE